MVNLLREYNSMTWGTTKSPRKRTYVSSMSVMILDRLGDEKVRAIKQFGGKLIQRTLKSDRSLHCQLFSMTARQEAKEKRYSLDHLMQQSIDVVRLWPKLE